MTKSLSLASLWALEVAPRWLLKKKKQFDIFPKIAEKILRKVFSGIKI